MIQVSHASVEFISGCTAVRDVSFSVDKGDFFLLCGASGAGKTTVMKLLYMDERPTSGTVSVCGYDSGRIRARDIPHLRRKLGIVFQDFKLLDDRTVYENVAFPLRATGATGRTIKQKVFQVLARTGLCHKSHYFPGRLSGGEQQRVCIARAIVNDPWVLLADEPVGNLDQGAAKEIVGLLQSINTGGTTVVMATHDAPLMDAGHYRRVMLSHGSIPDRGNVLSL